MPTYLLLASISLGACASASPTAHTSTNGTYRLPSGIADYDSLQRERSRCAAQSGTVVARPDADLTKLADYNCVIGGRP